MSNFTRKLNNFWSAKIRFFLQSKNWRVMLQKNVNKISRKKLSHRMICVRVTTAANLKNVVPRKSRLEIKWFQQYEYINIIFRDHLPFQIPIILLFLKKALLCYCSSSSRWSVDIRYVKAALESLNVYIFQMHFHSQARLGSVKIFS